MMMLAIEESLFRSVESALAFALSEQYIDLPQSPVSRMASGPSRTGNGLGGLDGFAQAGMILASMGTLSEAHRDILTARFSPAFGACACNRTCCRGYRHNARWLEAVSRISERIGFDEPAILPYLRLREGIVRKYFGDKVRISEVADVCGLHRNTASKYNSTILAILRAAEKQARFEVRAVLEESGVVGQG